MSRFNEMFLVAILIIVVIIGSVTFWFISRNDTTQPQE